MADPGGDQTVEALLATLLAGILAWIGNKLIERMKWLTKKMRVVLAFRRGDHVDPVDLKGDD